jgi:hypothetical protein
MDEIFEEVKLLSSAPIEIREKCNIRLQNMLNKIELDNLLITKRLTILCRIIDTARKCEAPKDVMDVILRRWDPTCVGKMDPDGILGDLAATYICSMENLMYLVSLYEYCTPMSILDSHIRARLDTGMLFNIVSDRILQAYEVDNLEEMEWEQLVKSAEDTQTLKSKRHTMDILSYIKSKLDIKNRKQIAPKPEWVNNKEVKDDVADTKRQIESFLNSTEVNEDVELFSNIISKTLDASSIQDFRTYGPINPIDGFDCLGRPGACRMFTCICREDDENELGQSEPFIGYCEVCQKTIRNYRCMVRLPVIGGGFIGCFCSFECLYKTELPLSEANDELIDDMFAMLKANGIQDIENC